ncbi:MAG: radical SAM protein [Spirochaetia bacterium]|jgi:MoaA/NifB/PqqE/SkfB family radical SAM enzyme|nr:radical SAM protein [Spirochaetia bacterium]
MELQHKATRVAIGTAIDVAIRHARKNKEEGIRDIVNLFTKYFAPTKADEKVGAGGNAFSGIAKFAQDPDSKWVRYISRLFEEIDPKVAKTLILNLAYEAGYRGLAKVRETSVKNDCNVPWAIIFDPTSACNMHCKGCWSGEYGTKQNLSFDDMDSIVTQAKELGAHFFLMTGGEPLVRKKDIVKLAKKHDDCVFHCFTNGTLVDEQFCQDMLDCGNILLAISLEGFKEENDFRRGDGSFDAVMKAMDLLNAHHLGFGTSVCWTSKNYKTVISDEFIDMIIEKGCRYAWYFHFMPVGQYTGTDLIPTPEDREYMMKHLRAVRNAHSDKLIVPLDFQDDGEFVGGCIAGGKHYLHINSNGDVEPCVFIHYSSANIHDVSLLDALKQPLFMEYHRNQPFNKNLYKPCPMLENPDFLPKLVKEAGAHSTDLEAPEDVDHLCAKCATYAKEWAPVADRLWEQVPETSRIKAEKAVLLKETAQKNAKREDA